MTFGERLKLLRKEKDISQEDLGIKIGVARTSVANYETNRNYPTSEVLEKISDVFNVSIDYLLGKSNVRNPKNENDDILDLAKVGFTKENYNPPTEKQKEQIRTIIETILADNKKDNKRDDSNK